MRVLTMNLWCRHGDWHARREVLRSGLAALDVDLAVLQEVVRNDGYDQVAELFPGDGWNVVHQNGRAADGSGAAIVSRWPVAKVTQKKLYHSARMDPQHGWIGSAAMAWIDTPGGEVLLAHHKPAWQLRLEHERERQAAELAGLIEEQRCERVILAGDFDATPDAASIRFWQGRQSIAGKSVCYRDCWTGPDGYTFTPDNPLVAGGELVAPVPRRIDYIMVRCNDLGPTLHIGSCRVVFDRPVDGVWASDHFGVVADIGVTRADI